MSGAQKVEMGTAPIAANGRVDRNVRGRAPRKGNEVKKEHIKAWITKYALTEGIEVADAEMCSDGGMIVYGNVGYGNQYAHGKDWHRTPEAALARAEEMRKAKIASLLKSIDKLERMTFKAPNVALRGEPLSASPSRK